jgi:hypothetical protein
MSAVAADGVPTFPALSVACAATCVVPSAAIVKVPCRPGADRRSPANSRQRRAFTTARKEASTNRCKAVHRGPHVCYCTLAVTDALPVSVNVHVLLLSPPLEHAPDQIASRPFETLSVIDHESTLTRSLKAPHTAASVRTSGRRFPRIQAAPKSLFGRGHHLGDEPRVSSSARNSCAGGTDRD